MIQRRVTRAIRSAGRLSAVALLPAMLVFGAATVRAQQTPSSPSVDSSNAKAAQDLMRSLMDAQTAHVAAVVNVTMAARMAELQKPETAQALATFVRNFYDALIAKGFTKEEALRIVAGFGGVATGSGTGGT